MDYKTEIQKALDTPGGHLFIGEFGSSLQYGVENGGTARLSGFDPDTVKPLAVEMGLPVIDLRKGDFITLAKLAISAPLVAVNQTPDTEPYHALSLAPLKYVAEAFRSAGAEIHNI